MRGATPELLSLLQRNPANIRNICILAHVDHGKTTLADALVASNGIISQRMAGKLRYMDSREDEQIRGITMKSSAISLIYNYSKDEYLINLIDSPGHVDFSSEVSTAVRLCEGAIVVVDVVEGVCPQTHAVLRQAFLENIKPVLVLNKIDRLIVELKMEPMEAFYHLQQILEQVNLVTNELFTVEAMEKSAVEVDDNGGNMSQIHEWTTDEDEENRNIYFCPDQGNVIFSSAYDGWGFSISDFAVLYASKLGINQEVLKRTLWGDFYLNTKTKRIMKGAQIKGKKPLFVQFILENLWSVYDTIYVRRDKEKTEKIITSLGLKILPRDMRHSDSRVQLQAVCSQWLPVSDAVLRVVVSKLPSPLAMSEERVEKLMCSHMRKFESLPSETQSLKQSFLTCSASEESPVIVFVSKMLPVDKKLLPQNKQRPLTAAEAAERRRKAREKMAEKLATQNKEQTTTEANTLHGESYEISLPENDTDSEEKGPDFVFIAFARVFSGTVRKGQKLYVLGPKHDPALISRKLQSGEEIKEATSIQELSHDDHVTCVTIKDLFVLMGRELEEMDHIPAGNILGIRGLEDHILKSATVSSSLMCPTFCDLYFDAAPIVRVAIEPIHTRDMQNLVTGLKLLNQADPCVQVLVQETGEHVIITAGEVHLQRCVEDIKERYAKIDINVSSPIVPFRETIVPPPKLDMVNEAISDRRQVLNKKDSEDEEVIEVGLVEVTTINRRCTLRIRAVPLPDDITRLLEENQNLIKTMGQISKSQGKGKGWLEVHQNVIDSIREFKCQLSKVFKGSGKMWRDAENQMWSFGPKRVGPNVLLNRVKGYDRANVWDCVETKQQELKLRQYDNSIISGFQIATLAGPLCEEPLRGVCFIIEEWDYIRSSNSISYDEDVQKLEVTDLNSCDNTMSESPSDVVSSETVQDGDDTESETKSSDSESEPSEQRQRMGHSHMSGQLIYCVKAACRKAFQTQPQRLMVAMYKCNIQATAEVLGKLCGVLGKRYGRVIEDTMKEGSQIFNIKAVLPVVESFGFTEDMRKKTSGLASPQLVFSHWEVVDVDPFWVPTTEEEYAHFGEKADSDNRALHYMNQVRKRKGLKVDEKIVEHAEKQRTLTKMK